MMLCALVGAAFGAVRSERLFSAETGRPPHFIAILAALSGSSSPKQRW
jgi:hypothetical protein